MKKCWFLYEARLCLCLVLLLLFQSCALFQQTEGVSAYKRQSTWQLVVKLAPGYDYDYLAVLPYYMQIDVSPREFLNLKPKYEEMCFTGSFEQMQQLRSALQMSGMVIKTDIRKIN